MVPLQVGSLDAGLVAMMRREMDTCGGSGGGGGNANGATRAPISSSSLPTPALTSSASQSLARECAAQARFNSRMSREVSAAVTRLLQPAFHSFVLTTLSAAKTFVGALTVYEPLRVSRLIHEGAVYIPTLSEVLGESGLEAERERRRRQRRRWRAGLMRSLDLDEREHGIGGGGSGGGGGGGGGGGVGNSAGAGAGRGDGLGDGGDDGDDNTHDDGSNGRPFVQDHFLRYLSAKDRRIAGVRRAYAADKEQKRWKGRVEAERNQQPGAPYTLSKFSLGSLRHGLAFLDAVRAVERSLSLLPLAPSTSAAAAAVAAAAAAATTSEAAAALVAEAAAAADLAEAESALGALVGDGAVARGNKGCSGSRSPGGGSPGSGARSPRSSDREARKPSQAAAIAARETCDALLSVYARFLSPKDEGEGAEGDEGDGRGKGNERKGGGRSTATGTKDEEARDAVLYPRANARWHRVSLALVPAEEAAAAAREAAPWLERRRRRRRRERRQRRRREQRQRRNEARRAERRALAAAAAAAEAEARVDAEAAGGEEKAKLCVSCGR